MGSFLYKPIGQGAIGGGKANFLLGNTNLISGGFYDEKGNLVERFGRAQGTPEPGQTPGVKFYANKAGGAYGQNLTAKFTDNTGKVYSYSLANGGQRYEGDLNNPNSLKAVNKGPLGGGGGAGTGQAQVGANGAITQPGNTGSFPANFAPGNIGFGAFPAYLGGEFPNSTHAEFGAITPADYKFTNPQDFASKYGDFNRGELRKNQDLATEFSNQTIQSELSTLQGYVPAASALQRSTVGNDNPFNQNQRDAAVAAALPNARRDLSAQADRANSYARGDIPDSITDNAFEVSSRSKSADEVAQGGFGSASTAGRKVSDLESAAQRIQLSQYGDQLLSSNTNQQASLFLAPTEYANAGSQVRVTPSVSPSELINSNRQQIDANTTISPTNALSSTVQQNQFGTELQQQTNEFNANGLFSASQFNANADNSFALTKFQYDTGYAAALAGASQTNINTGVAAQQQAAAQQIFQDSQGDTQRANTIGSIVQGAGTVATVAGSFLSAQTGPQTASPGVQQAAASAPDLSYSVPQGVQTPEQVASGSSAPQGNTSPIATQSAISPSASGRIDRGAVVESAPSGGQGSYSIPPPVQSFASDMKYSGPGLSSPNAAVTDQLLSSGAAISGAAGIYHEPGPGRVASGVTTSGTQTYAAIPLIQSSNIQAGATLAATLGSVAGQLLGSSSHDATVGTAGDDVEAATGAIAQAASDHDLIGQLNDKAASNDPEGFVNTLSAGLDHPDVDTSSKTDLGKASQYGAHQLFQNWNNMSPAQKSLGIAAVGIHGLTADGNPLVTKEIKPATGATPSMKVGDALSMLNTGVNAFALTNKWDQANKLSKIVGGKTDAIGVGQNSKQLGVLGAGGQGAEVPGVSHTSLAKSGWEPAPHFGVGAVVGSSVSSLPKGYQLVARGKDGSTIAAPTGTASTARGAIANSVVGTAGGVGGVAQNVRNIQANWGKDDKALNGTAGGSAMLAGLAKTKQTAPYVFGAAAASAVYSKEANDPKARDIARSKLESAGLLDNGTVRLTNGTKVDVGTTGVGAGRKVSNPQNLAGNDNNSGKLNSWNSDYTSSNDYVAGMSGVTLSRLINGGKGSGVDQVGSQIGNAAASVVGLGKDSDTQTHAATAQELRAMYSKAGIKSKADGYQLTNQGYAQGRFNDLDVHAMHASLDATFDRNPNLSPLLSGRVRGVEVGNEAPVTDTASTDSSKSKPTRQLLSRSDIRAQNESRYAGIAA